MSDRFDFLEIGEPPLAIKPDLPAQPGDVALPDASDFGWRSQRLKAVEIIGEAGKGVGEFNGPTGLAVDAYGALYVADSNNHRVQRIMANGDVFVFGKAGHGQSELWGPMDVAIDQAGDTVFVVEQGNQRIQGFRATGQFLGMMSGFARPSGIAFDAEGMLWIADTGNDRVLRLDLKTGAFPTTIDRSAGIKRPTAVHCDCFRNLHITNGMEANVGRYSFAGKRLGGLGDHRKLQAPSQVAADSFGRVYVAETDADRLHVFDLHANSIATFDRLSTRQGSLSRPQGVAIAANGDVYVSDTGNNRVVRLSWA